MQEPKHAYNSDKSIKSLVSVVGEYMVGFQNISPPRHPDVFPGDKKN